MQRPDVTENGRVPQPDDGETEFGRIEYYKFPFNHALLLGDFQERFPFRKKFEEFCNERIPVLILGACKTRAACAKVVPNDLLINQLAYPRMNPEQRQQHLVGLLIAHTQKQDYNKISSLLFLTASCVERDGDDIRDGLIQFWQDYAGAKGWQRLMIPGEHLEKGEDFEKKEVKRFRRRHFKPADPDHPLFAMHWDPPPMQPQE